MTTGVYIAHAHGYVKPGITSVFDSRMVNYGKAGGEPIIHWLAIANPGFDFHCVNLEKHIKAKLSNKFEMFNHFNESEYIDPIKHPDITWKYIAKLAEKRIKEASQPIKIVKKEHLPIDLSSPNVKTFFDSIKKFPDKYLDNI